MAVKSIQHNKHTFDISYEIINPSAKVDIVILHGWGSNKEIMKGSFSSYLNDFRHIYIDLPGFGKSTCAVELQTSDVAKIVELLLQEINGTKDIIMGHSFGGKVATLMEPKMLVLLSSAGIYVPKSLKIRTKIAIFKILKLFGFSKFRSLFVAEDAKALSEPMYKTFKNVVDEDFSDVFLSYNSKALVCWGRDDTATPISSGEKIVSLIKDSKFEVYDGDHFFFTKHSQDISSKIKDTFLEKLGN